MKRIVLTVNRRKKQIYKMSTKRATITERQFTFAWLFQGAESEFEEAVSVEEGSFYNFMFSVVFLAFSIEAYLNQIGEKLFPDWAKYERRPHKEKLKKVVRRLKFKPDFSSLPFQSYDEIFRFRNLIAHAKPGEFSEFERVCNLGSVFKFLCCTESMITEIHKKFVEYIETHEDENGEDFFEDTGMLKSNPFGIMGISISDE